MDKFSYLIEAIVNGAARERRWVIGAFAITFDRDNAYKADPYPYRIVRNDAGIWYTDKQGELVQIMQGDKPLVLEKTEPLFWPWEKFTLPANSLINQPEEKETTAGRFLQNALLIAGVFKDKIPYINKSFGIGDIEDIIVKRFRSDVKKGEEEDNTCFYIRERLALSRVIDYMRGFSEIFVVAGTRKTMTSAPGIRQKRDELYEKYKDSIHELATIAKINKELQEYDDDYLKGDIGEPNMGKKQREIVRGKLYRTMGSNEGLDSNGVTAVPIANSLEEGHDPTLFTEYVNESRFGSYSRGKLTQYGGVIVKKIDAATSGTRVGSDDCGTTFGEQRVITDSEIKKVIGRSIIYNGKTVKMDSEATALEYKGKTVMIRFPDTCIEEGTRRCKACLGDKLTLNEDALGAAAISEGSIMMLINMKAMHGKSLRTVSYDPMKCFN